jgi:hypothetical protein
MQSLKSFSLINKILIFLFLISLSFFSLKVINQIETSISMAIGGEVNLVKVKQEITELAEDKARTQSRGIAKQMQIYLNGHPEMTLEDLQNSSVFQNIAVQEYGKKSYSAILSSDCVTVFHISPKVVGIHSKDFEKELNIPTDEIWQIHKLACEQGIESEGYYTWRHREGYAPERKFIRMAYAGVTADEKKLYVGATTYIENFNISVRQLETEIEAERIVLLKEVTETAKEASDRVLIITVISLVFFALISLKEKYYLKNDQE